MKKRILILCSSYLLPFFAAISFGNCSEFQSRGNTEAIYLESAGIDLDIQYGLTSKATSIDFVGYSQTMDEFGEPFLQAVRHAQKTNLAPVRFLYDRMVSFQGKDYLNEVKNVISDPSLVCPGEALCAHPVEKLSSGLGVLDYIHEKLLILNRGTSREVIIVGFGRGKTADSANWLDSSVLFRRIDPNLPYVGDDIQSVFDSLYTSLKKLADKSIVRIPSKTKRGPKRTLEEPNKTFSKTLKEKNRVKEILAVLNRPAHAQNASSLASFQFQPSAIKLTSNDLFAQLLHPKADRKKLHNDNLKVLINRFENFSGTADWTSYSFGPTEEVENAIVAFLNKGAHNNVNLFVNGASAFQAAFNMQYPVFYTFNSVARIIKRLHSGAGKINLRMYDPNLAGDAEAPYLHRRMVVFSNEVTKEVLAGSDPLTWSSANLNDEILLSVVDDRMTELMKKINEVERRHYELISYENILKQSKNPSFSYRCLQTLVKWIF